MSRAGKRFPGPGTDIFTDNSESVFSFKSACSQLDIQYSLSTVLWACSCRLAGCPRLLAFVSKRYSSCVIPGGSIPDFASHPATHTFYFSSLVSRTTQIESEKEKKKKEGETGPRHGRRHQLLPGTPPGPVRSVP